MADFTYRGTLFRDVDGGGRYFVEEGAPALMGPALVWRRHALGEWVAVVPDGPSRFRGRGKSPRAALANAWERAWLGRRESRRRSRTGGAAA